MLLPHDPKEIGGIQILDRLGSGGAGIVYKGRDKDNEIVALKVLHAEFANNQTVRKRLEREADAMRSVKGNRTVKIRRIELDVAQPFIVMDFAEGENLANYIANNGVLKGQALNDFALQLAEAIRDIHKAKVIHRDLKPTNVIIGPDGLKVVDFGISIVSEVTGMTQTGLMVGTVSWLSPEQILGKEITQKTDIFNYGLVLGYAATGKHPFGEGKPEAVMFRILNSDPELNNIKTEYKIEIVKYLEKNPEKRINTLSIFGSGNNIQSKSTRRFIPLQKYKKALLGSLVATILIPAVILYNSSLDKTSIDPSVSNSEDRITQSKRDALLTPIPTPNDQAIETANSSKSEFSETTESNENAKQESVQTNKKVNPKLAGYTICTKIIHTYGISGKSDSKQKCGNDYELEIVDSYYYNSPAAIVQVTESGQKRNQDELFYCVTKLAFIRFKDVNHRGETYVNFSEPYGQNISTENVDYFENKLCKKYGNDKVARPTGFGTFAFPNQSAKALNLTSNKFIEYYYIIHNQNSDRIEIQTTLQKIEKKEINSQSGQNISGKNSGKLCFEKTQENRTFKKCKNIIDKRSYFNYFTTDEYSPFFKHAESMMWSPWVGEPMCLKQDVRYTWFKEINGFRAEERNDISTVVATSNVQTNNSCKELLPPEFLDVTLPVYFESEFKGEQVAILEMRSINENPIIVKATWTPSPN
jgi:serine/threonine protein kinase